MAAPNKPIFTEQELFDHIKEYFYDFKVTLNDIKNPSQPFVMEFYKRVMVEYDIDVDTVLQPQMCQTANLLHPEAYTDIIPIRNLVYAITSFGIFKTYQGFRITDLVNPKPKRNLILMSAMMHFLKFCDFHLETIQDKLNHVEKMKQERDNLLKTRNELKEAIQNKAIGRAQKEILMEELKKDYTSLLEEQTSVIKRKEECVSMQENAKARLAEAEHNLKKAKQKQMEILEELNELKGHVVESPKQVVDEFHTLQKKAKEMKKKKETMQNLIQIKQQTTEKLSNELNAQKERNAELKEIVDLIHRTREAEVELEKMNKKYANIKEEDEELIRQYNELKETIAARSKELKAVQDEAKSLENTVKAAAKENENLKKVGNTADIVKKIDELNQTIEKKKEEFLKLVNESHALYKEIIKKGEDSNDAIMKQINEARKVP